MFKGVRLLTIVWWRFARRYEVNLKNKTPQSLIHPSNWVYKVLLTLMSVMNFRTFVFTFLNVCSFWSRDGQSFRCDLTNLYQKLPITSGASYLHCSSTELKKISALAHLLGSWILILYVVLRATEIAVTWIVRELLRSDFRYFKVQNNPYDKPRCVLM